MSSRSVNVINALYGNELRSRRLGLLDWILPRRRRSILEAQKHEKRILALYQEREKTLTKGRVVVLIIACILSAIALTSVVYFNRLTTQEQDVMKERAKIDCILQRRRDISINLARTVRDYAVHEQGIFNHVSNMRGTAKEQKMKSQEAPTSADPAPMAEAPENPAIASEKLQNGGILEDVISMLEGKNAGSLTADQKLASLMAVAESYPDLKLSDNFQKFMEALVETEKELSVRRMAYADVVNTYSTQLKTLPGRLFASLYGFKERPYFTADPDARQFRPVEY